MITDAREQQRTAIRRRSSRAQRAATAVTPEARPEEPARTVPTIRSAFRSVDGKLHHARCGRPIELVGVRGGVELDFRCIGCWEHVTLTPASITRLPVGQGNAG
jgi:hypothetical protein